MAEAPAVEGEDVEAWLAQGLLAGLAALLPAPLIPRAWLSIWLLYPLDPTWFLIAAEVPLSAAVLLGTSVPFHLVTRSRPLLLALGTGCHVSIGLVWVAMVGPLAALGGPVWLRVLLWPGEILAVVMQVLLGG